MTEEKYTFTYECGDTGITMTIGEGLDVHQMCGQFENFLLATGYRLREHESIGVTDGDPDAAPASKTDDYIGSLFESGSGNHIRFDGANAWAEEQARAGGYIGHDDDLIGLQ
jgi:hypothetical protein